MKKLILALCITCTTTFFAQNTLGLAERRALKEYQDTQFTTIKKSIETAAGYAVAMDVKWDQIAKVGESDKYKENIYFGTTIFEPLRLAFASIASDKMGKEALQAKLKKVVIVHDPETAPASNYANGLAFEEGILTINWTPYSNTDENSMAERVDALKTLIESKL